MPSAVILPERSQKAPDKLAWKWPGSFTHSHPEVLALSRPLAGLLGPRESQSQNDGFADSNWLGGAGSKKRVL